MNCAARVIPHIAERPHAAALWTEQSGVVTFADFGALCANAQATARAEGLKAGDTVLVLAAPGPALFATMIGFIGLGICLVSVEPWLSVAEIEHVIRRVRPRAFVGSMLALLWGARVSAIRNIPRWLRIGRVVRGRSPEAFRAADVEPATPAVITFTSGTTGRPKGVLRTHRYMWDLHEILTAQGTRDAFDRPDLCVLPNLALLHLATGRGAVLVPGDWSEKALRAINSVPPHLQPASVTCGPGFLLRLLRRPNGAGFHGLRSIHIGGAQTDCWIFERAFEQWPAAQFTHVYGGTEAEPVALADAHESVAKSRARGRFQVLHIGLPIPELRTEIRAEGLCVSGPNVAQAYAPEKGSQESSATGAERWHCMGDRVVEDCDGWWYGGRVARPASDFDLEQRIYSFLATSKCFVHRGRDGRAILFGERLRPRIEAAGAPLQSAFPEIAEVRELTIVRDRRHRARIDRAASLAKARYTDA